MSTVAKLAEFDAAVGENELTDEEADRLRGLVADEIPLADALAQVLAAREPEPEPRPAADDSAEDLGEPLPRQLRDLERQVTKHEEKIREIMGGHVAGFGPCSHCGGVGLEQPGPQPQTHVNYIPCPTCLGFGQVLTGSLRDGNTERDCPMCAGLGFLEALNEQGVPLSEAARANGGAEQRPPETLQPPQPVQPGHVAPETRYGRPAWMGDPTIGQ